jgi:hypothetical protein
MEVGMNFREIGLEEPSLLGPDPTLVVFLDPRGPDTALFTKTPFNPVTDGGERWP